MHVDKWLGLLMRRWTRSFGARRVQLDRPLSVSPVSNVFGFDRGQPLDRYYIDKFLNANSSLISGDCLEVGDDGYLSRYGAQSSVRYVLKFSDQEGGRIENNELYCDITQIASLPEGRFDTLVFTQTLNFVYEVDLAIQGMRRLLRSGGHALITVSGISQISRYDHDRWGDYWRFTDLSLRRLLLKYFEPGDVSVVTYGNVALACMFLQGLAQEDVLDQKIFDHMDPDYQMVVCAVVRKR